MCKLAEMKSRLTVWNSTWAACQGKKSRLKGLYLKIPCQKFEGIDIWTEFTQLGMQVGLNQ